MNHTEASSTRPYLIRALHEWCSDNGLTPYITVQADETTQVPKEYVKNGEIVLCISFDATHGLKLGNDYLEFKGRFAGVARDVIVPVNRVIAIFAKENSQGMAFPSMPHDTTATLQPSAAKTTSLPSITEKQVEVMQKIGKLVAVKPVDSAIKPSKPPETSPALDESKQMPADSDEPPKKPPAGTRPQLTRVK